MVTKDNYRFRLYAGIATVLALIALALFLPAKPAQAQTVPPLSAGDVTTSRGAPVAASEWASIGTTALGTTPAFMFAADITAAQQRSDFVQSIRIVNRSAAAYVCFAPVARTASGCTTDCSGSGLTCSGASTDGDVVLPSNSYSIAINGNACACWVASGASTSANAARVARFPL